MSTREAESAREELAALAGRYARPDRWAPVPPAIDRAVAADAALAAAARRARLGLPAEVARRIGLMLPGESFARYLGALVDVPRERFVLPEDLAFSAADLPLPLDREGLATVSAPHAYLLTYGLLALGPGDHLIELGTGTGYGAALALSIVERGGRVASIEIDPILAPRAALVLGLYAPDAAERLALFEGDACELAQGLLQEAAGPVKVGVTFALQAEPEALIARLPEGSILVAPVGSSEEGQELVRWERSGGALQRSAHGAVRYVGERH